MNNNYIIAAYAVSFLGLISIVAFSYYRYRLLKKALKAFEK
jgi:hypothetical protein